MSVVSLRWEELSKKSASTPRDSSKHFPEIKVFRNGGLWQARSGEPTCVIGVAYALADGSGRLARDVVFLCLNSQLFHPESHHPSPILDLIFGNPQLKCWLEAWMGLRDQCDRV